MVASEVGKFIAASANRTRLRRLVITAISGITPCATDAEERYRPGDAWTNYRWSRCFFSATVNCWLFPLRGSVAEQALPSKGKKQYSSDKATFRMAIKRTAPAVKRVALYLLAASTLYCLRVVATRRLGAEAAELSTGCWTAGTPDRLVFCTSCETAPRIHRDFIMKDTPREKKKKKWWN